MRSDPWLRRLLLGADGTLLLRIGRTLVPLTAEEIAIVLAAVRNGLIEGLSVVEAGRRRARKAH
jgi:hypothetical protein